MLFSVKKIKDDFLQKIYNNSMNELNDFFELNWTENLPNIILLSDRDMIDSFLNKKTDDWLVAWAGQNEILILDRNNYERESSHKYSDKEYTTLIKHELSHLFIRHFKKRGFLPRWFEEGICIYVSGQVQLKERPSEFNKFLDYCESGGKGVYNESGFIIGLLVKNFGKQKLLRLLKKSEKIQDNSEFKEKFKKIYGLKLNYINFNRLLKYT